MNPQRRLQPRGWGDRRQTIGGPGTPSDRHHSNAMALAKTPPTPLPATRTPRSSSRWKPAVSRQHNGGCLDQRSSPLREEGRMRASPAISRLGEHAPMARRPQPTAERNPAHEARREPLAPHTTGSRGRRSNAAADAVTSPLLAHKARRSSSGRLHICGLGLTEAPPTWRRPADT